MGSPRFSVTKMHHHVWAALQSAARSRLTQPERTTNLIDGHVSLSQTVKLLLFALFVLFETASDKLSPQGHFLGCDQPWRSLCPAGLEPTVTLLLRFFTLKACPTDTYNVLSVTRQICGLWVRSNPQGSASLVFLCALADDYITY